MKGGRLEVFLVGSKGIGNSSLIAKPACYVVTECGTQKRRSKTLKGSQNKFYWNEKFTFELPVYEFEKLTFLKFMIMNEECFGDGKFLGETIVDLETIIMEGNDKGFIELIPSQYNVVLKDGTYNGELKLGLRFTPNTDIHPERKELVEEEDEEETAKTICKALMNFWKISRWRFLHFCRNLDNDDKHKET